jgi:hypothetical protein
MDELDFAKVKLARLPTRIEILKLSLGCLVAVLGAFWPPLDFFGGLFAPLRTLDASQPPLTVEQPSSGIPLHGRRSA